MDSDDAGKHIPRIGIEQAVEQLGGAALETERLNLVNSTRSNEDDVDAFMAATIEAALWIGVVAGWRLRGVLEGKDDVHLSQDIEAHRARQTSPRRDGAR